MGVHHKTTPEQRAEITRRYAAGEHTRQIANDYGITPQMVCYYARRSGVPRRHGWTTRPDSNLRRYA